MGITKKQKEVYDYICSYSLSNGHAPTQKEIKEHFNLKSFGSVQRYIKYLTDAGYLEGDWNARRGLKLADPYGGQTPYPEEAQIPLLGLVAAGNPIEAIENPTESLSVPMNMIKKGERYFALTIQGESMIEDGIFDGDTVICRECNHARNGQTVVAVVEGEATVKNFFKNGSSIELHPANSSMSPIIVTSGDFRIAGIIAGLIRNYE